MVSSVAYAVSASSPHSINPWAKSTNPAPFPRPAELRAKAAKYYECYRNMNKTIIAKCHLTGEEGNGKEVTLAHLLPRSTAGHILKDLDVESVDDMRNVIFLCSTIEKSFDDQRLCFVCDDHRAGCFRLKIWDEKIRNVHLLSGAHQKTHDKPKTIGNFENEQMVFEEPYSRVLSMHAQESYDHPIRKRWIETIEPRPTVYGSPLKDVLRFEQLATTSTILTAVFDTFLVVLD
jgi:hypothetical protein